MVLDRPINGRSVRAYVERFLAPGDIVVANNLDSHRVAGVRAAIEAQGAELRFPPQYSPNLNPIEQVFAILKTLLRREEPRTRKCLSGTIGQLLDRFSPVECRNYLAKACNGQTT